MPREAHPSEEAIEVLVVAGGFGRAAALSLSSASSEMAAKVLAAAGDFGRAAVSCRFGGGWRRWIGVLIRVIRWAYLLWLRLCRAGSISVICGLHLCLFLVPRMTF